MIKSIRRVGEQFWKPSMESPPQAANAEQQITTRATAGESETVHEFHVVYRKVRAMTGEG